MWRVGKVGCDPQKLNLEAFSRLASHPAKSPLVAIVVKASLEEALALLIVCCCKQFAVHRDTRLEQDTVPALNKFVAYRRNT